MGNPEGSPPGGEEIKVSPARTVVGFVGLNESGSIWG